MLTGLRGVGKTVLLNKVRLDAEDSGIETLRIEAPEDRSLPAILLPELRQTLLRMSRIHQAKDLAEKALRALASFVKAMKLKYDDIEVGIDLEPEPGLADNGDLEQDLQMLLEAVGRAAAKADTHLLRLQSETTFHAPPTLNNLRRKASTLQPLPHHTSYP